MHPSEHIGEIASETTDVKRATILLRILLIANGVLTLFALPAVFMPSSWMDTMHRQLGLGPLPEGAIVQYLARSISALYAAFGCLTLLLAWDLRRFAPLVVWWGTTAIVFGAVMIWIDLTAGMPPHWTWGEGPYVICTGAAVLLLERLARDKPGPRAAA